MHKLKLVSMVLYKDNVQLAWIFLPLLDSHRKQIWSLNKEKKKQYCHYLNI